MFTTSTETSSPNVTRGNPRRDPSHPAHQGEKLGRQGFNVTNGALPLFEQTGPVGENGEICEKVLKRSVSKGSK